MLAGVLDQHYKGHAGSFGRRDKTQVAWRDNALMFCVTPSTIHTIHTNHFIHACICVWQRALGKWWEVYEFIYLASIVRIV